MRSRSLFRAAVAGAALLVAIPVALADDSGVHDFLVNIFGGGGAAAPAPVAAPVVPIYRGEDVIRPRHRSRVVERRHPLTIHRYAAVTPRDLSDPEAIARPAKPRVTSIYDDPTLRVGDAVMTKEGVRVFAGSASFPYRPSDFVKLGEAHALSRSMIGTLAELNTLPRT